VLLNDVLHLLSVYRDYGGKLSFSGPAATIRCYENNPLVRKVRENVAPTGSGVVRSGVRGMSEGGLAWSGGVRYAKGRNAHNC